MERVVFVIESSNDHIPCLLNPESLLLQRRAGVKTRQFNGGLITGNDLADDPLIFTGGGSTELTINLLFDVNISGAGTDHSDVRKLTGPLWRLSENESQGESHKCPALVRLVWGKAFSFHGVITDIAERLEYFTAEGVSQRSFLRMRMRRVAEYTEEQLMGGKVVPPSMPDDLNSPAPRLDEKATIHSVMGSLAGNDGGNGGEAERLDQLAYEHYGDPSQWRLLAWVNNIADPAEVAAGQVLSLPKQGDELR
ncbi:MAG: hypothetical protein ACI82Z_000398 [Cellvibrionaceae bacterium]|jgi:hypothetical protein